MEPSIGGEPNGRLWNKDVSGTFEKNRESALRCAVRHLICSSQVLRRVSGVQKLL